MYTLTEYRYIVHTFCMIHPHWGREFSPLIREYDIDKPVGFFSLFFLLSFYNNNIYIIMIARITSVQVIFVVDTVVSYYCIYYEYYQLEQTLSATSFSQWF